MHRPRTWHLSSRGVNTAHTSIAHISAPEGHIPGVGSRTNCMQAFPVFFGAQTAQSVNNIVVASAMPATSAWQEELMTDICLLANLSTAEVKGLHALNQEVQHKEYAVPDSEPSFVHLKGSAMRYLNYLGNCLAN